jgi:ATP:corrinoid adenosyltransferase
VGRCGNCRQHHAELGELSFRLVELDELIYFLNYGNVHVDGVLEALA